jgi:hypothetical protein
MIAIFVPFGFFNQPNALYRYGETKDGGRPFKSPNPKFTHGIEVVLKLNQKVHEEVKF